jgi:hypothetical protein
MRLREKADYAEEQPGFVCEWRFKLTKLNATLGLTLTHQGVALLILENRFHSSFRRTHENQY